MNKLILIKSGRYTGQRVMAEQVMAQDGLRYSIQMDGKIIGLMPRDVVVLPDSHPLNQTKETDPETIPPTDVSEPVSDLAPKEPIRAVIEPVAIRLHPSQLRSQNRLKKGVPIATAVEEIKEVLKGQKRKGMDIVIDFDGTVVTHEFPRIGKDIGAVPILKELVSNGHRLILFTMRSDIETATSSDPEIHCQGGSYLTEAVNWFKKHDIPLFGVQVNPNQKTWTNSPKAYGKVIIDDAALGCPLQFNRKLSSRPFVDWKKVRRQLVSMRMLEDQDSKLF